MITFAPILPWQALLPWVLLVLLLVLHGHRRLLGLVTGRYVAMLSVLRALCLALFSVLLLRPCIERAAPDSSAFRALLLGDCSASMRIMDHRGGPRIAQIAQVFEVLQESPEVFGTGSVALGFAENVLPLAVPPGIMPGNTAVGEALQEVLQRQGNEDLGAVVLVSDGNWNSGVSPIQVAKLFGEADLPISCVAAGTLRRPGDVSIMPSEAKVAARRGQPVQLVFSVSNTFPDPTTVEVAFGSPEGRIGSRTVDLPAGPASVDVVFEDTPYQSGVSVYRAAVAPPPSDVIPETDIAYLAVEVGEPETFTVAYLSGSLNWQYKMLKSALSGNSQFRLSAMINAGGGVFHRYGLPFKDAEVPFPTSVKELTEFNAIVLHVSALRLLGEEAGQLLRDYVSRRGGGLLVIGRSVPEDLQGLLPVAGLRSDAPPGPVYLDVDGEALFPENVASSLHSTPGLYLPADFPVSIATELKRGGRSGLSPSGSEEAVLAVQHYGSGRAAFCGFEGSWRWRLEGGESMVRHGLFWEHLLVWLSSSSKPRMAVPVDGRQVPVSRQTVLAAEILGRDYRPVPNAQASLVVTAPDGATVEHGMLPVSGEAERFETLFLPEQPGEYTMTVTARMPDGETVVRDAYFLAAPGDSEMLDPGRREDVLRDIARISGGDYFEADETGRLARGIPLSKRVPMKTEKRYPAESIPFAAALAAVACLEWYARRRIGLK